MKKRSLLSVVLLPAAAAVALTACGMSVNPTNSGLPSGSSAPTALQPATLGNGQCQASSAGSGVFAQVAVSGASCADAADVAAAAGNAKGSSYTEKGFACTPTPEGTNSPWSAAWSGTYYAYSCKDGSKQIAFNWGTDYVYGQSQTSSTTTTSTSGALQPTSVGQGECPAGPAGNGTYAQVAVLGTSCQVAANVAGAAGGSNGAAYTASGFTCNATSEGSGSAWSSAWGGTYYAYSCIDGSQQIAFNWGTDYTY